ncbi:MAG: calcium-translocating P-type ATPase, PMCA-type [Cetobacterium sp.]
MFYQKSKEETLELLKSSSKGLTTQEATKRLEEFGGNELKEKSKTSTWQMIVDSFKDPLVIILVLAAVVQMFLGEMVESLVIFIVLILNSILGVVQSKKAEGALEALKEFSSPNAKVYRDGHLKNISAKELVPGDIILLEAGDYVPADGRILEGQSLKIVEGMLTGESEPVLKNEDVIGEEAALGDRKNTVYSGAMVVYGRGKIVITHTGMSTEMGKIANLIENAESEETPLQKNLEKFSKKLGIWIMILCLAIFAIMTIRGLGGQEDLFQIIIKSFMFAVAVAVAAIPEALSSIVTIVLAVGTNTMAKKHAIVRKLHAVETLGATAVICTDKTGTLTQNKMTVEQHFVYDKTLNENKNNIFNIGMGLVNDTQISETGETLGDPTETALIDYIIKEGIDYKGLRKEYPRVSEIPFDSDRKIMSTLNKFENKFMMFVKGAPDVVLGRCTKILSNGEEILLTEEIKQKIAKENENFSKQALRVLAVGYKTYGEKKNLQLEDEYEFVFVGLVAMMDPPREEVYSAIKEAKSAGIKPIMITGDHKITASAIAKKIGLMVEGEKALTGKELDALTDEELDLNLEKITVYARVSPENKIRIVKAWQKKGKITAMTGDGVNDAPALKQANIGVAMGTGTEVAKGSSEMILTDDNFATIVHAVETGRTVYENIKKSINYLFAGNLGAIIAILFALFAGWENPFTPLQLLFINLINDSMPAIALGLEQPEKTIMDRKPRDPKEGLFTCSSLKGIITRGVLIGIAVILAQYIGDNVFSGMGEAMAFTTVVFARILQTFPARSEKESLISLGVFSNKYIVLAVIVCFAIYTISLIPSFRGIFDIPLHFGFQELGICLGLSFGAMLLMEVEKIFDRKKSMC